MGTRNLYHLSKQLKWNMELRQKILLRTGSPQQGSWVRSQCWASQGKGYEQGCGNTVLFQLSVCSRLMPAGFMKERSRTWWFLQWSPACCGLHWVLGGLEILPTSMLSSIRKKAVAELILKKFQILWVLQGRMPPSSITSEGGGMTCSFGSFLSSFLPSVQFSCSVVCDSLRPHESQHTRPPCPSQTPGVHWDSRPSSQWCYPAISSSVVPFSSCTQSLPESESFPMSQLFTWGGQSIGVPALASFLPKNTQNWSPLEWTGWISLQSKELSRVFSNTTIQKYQFFGAQLSSQSNSHIHTWLLEKQ